MPIGIPAAMLVSSLIGVGGSAVAGALNNRGKSQSTTPTYSPQQLHIQKQLGDQLQYDIANPSKGLEPLKTSTIGNVNKTYDGIQDRMDSKLSAQGFGRSGKVATNTRKVEVERAGKIADVENQFSAEELAQKNRLMQMMQQFGFQTPGQTTTGSGNMAGGAISGGLETATLLYALSKMGGGGFGFGGGGGADISRPGEFPTP